MTDHPDPARAFAAHNHKRCSGEVLREAGRIAEAGRLRLTPVRRRTLEILLEEHRALGAYEVLARLAEEGFGRQPPVAYRALEFLVDHGLAHRIRRLNAFAACMSPGADHAPVFFICEACNGVAEAPGEAVAAELASAARGIGFHVDRSTVEIAGVCPACQEAAPCR